MRVVTIGTFDILHRGHIELLAYLAKVAGEPVTVGLNTDEFVQAYKGQPPAVPYADRETVLRAFQYVGEVFPYTGPENRFLDWATYELEPLVLGIGSDWHEKDYLGHLGVTWQQLGEQRVSILYVPRTTGQSSSAIRGAILGLSGWLLAKEGALTAFGIVSDAAAHTTTVYWDKLSSALVIGLPALIAGVIKLTQHQATQLVIKQKGEPQ